MNGMVVILMQATHNPNPNPNPNGCMATKISQLARRKKIVIKKVKGGQKIQWHRSIAYNCRVKQFWNQCFIIEHVSAVEVESWKITPKYEFSKKFKTGAI